MWLRLRQLALVATRLEPVADDLREVFGLEVGHIDPGVETFGLHNAILPVGNQFIEIVAPIREGTAGGRYLERRKGDGGYMVILQCDDHVPRKRRVAELGIRKPLEFDGDDYRCMQLHPRDTGGSFLEVDWQAGADGADGGPWSPAGRDWRRAVHTDRVRAIRAAELQAPDPDQLAARWAEILELPVERGALGPELPLQNARLRFVQDRDGRGEGLGGIDLQAGDRPRVLEAARRQGRLVGDALEIGGVRFRLVD